jgi:4-aminobutyrate aminotransferase-like enzyme
MMVAEFVQEDGNKSESEAQAPHLLLPATGTYDQVMRFVPPLVVAEEAIEQGVEILGGTSAAAPTK